MRIKLLIMITVLVFSIALTGCDEQDPLMGKWEEPSSGISIEFKDDGTLVMGRETVSYTMNYEKQDPDIILFKGSADGSIPDQRMTYKVEDDHLILSIDGIDTVFNRKK